MILEMIFSGCSTLAVIGWLALALAPLGRGYAIGFARGVALILAVAYLAQMFLITETVDGASFMTLAGINALADKAGNVMLGWTHYLAFDLFIGSWEAEDAAARGVPHWILIACLFLTFMVGPIGLLVYFAVRSVRWQAAKTAPIISG